MNTKLVVVLISIIKLKCGLRASLASFLQVPVIGCQWFSSTLLNDSFYAKQIAPSRTFCIYEEVSFKTSPSIILLSTLTVICCFLIEYTFEHWRLKNINYFVFLPSGLFFRRTEYKSYSKFMMSAI